MNPKSDTDAASKTIIKPEPDLPSSDDDDEGDIAAASNARAKAALYAHITQQQVRADPGATEQPNQSQLHAPRHGLPSRRAAAPAFGTTPNHFPQVNMTAPMNAHQIRNAAAREAIASAGGAGMVAASTTGLHGDGGRVPHHGGGRATTIQGHGRGGGHHQQQQQVEVEVDEDMTAGLPPRDDDPDDEYSAFNAAMYGAGGSGTGGLFGGWA